MLFSCVIFEGTFGSNLKEMPMSSREGHCDCKNLTCQEK